jgi:acetolactate synthase-1/2/3 large subunit
MVEIPDDQLVIHKPIINRCYNVTDRELTQAKDLLAKAERPLLIVGHGVLLAEAWEEVREFARQERIPVISTLLGIGVFESNDPLYFSWLGMHGMKYANLAVQESDLIFALGIRFDDRITGKLSEFAPKATIIHADIDKSEQGKNVPTRLFLHADIKPLMYNMPATLTDSNRKHREQWLERLNAMRELYPLKRDASDTFSAVRALQALNDMLPENAIIATDVGQHQMWAAQYLERIQPNHFLTSGGLGSMGFGLPAAMGAQAAMPKNSVWCITGDGGFQMNAQELITCVQEGWPVKILILDNRYLGMVRQWQEQFYESRYSGVELLNPDFVKLAEACHVPATSVENFADLREAIYTASQTPGPFLIQAKVVREENVLPMVPPNTSLSETLYYPQKHHANKALLSNRVPALS